jgi:hypothetical protein
MRKIMDDYLRPAGYEFQKVQHDYERLMQGKALFDRDAIETLESCDNNNERHEVLSTIANFEHPPKSGQVQCESTQSENAAESTPYSQEVLRN